MTSRTRSDKPILLDFIRFFLSELVIKMMYSTNHPVKKYKNQIIRVINQGVNIDHETNLLMYNIFNCGDLDIIKQFLWHHPEAHLIKFSIGKCAFSCALDSKSNDVAEYLVSLDEFLPDNIDFSELLHIRHRLNSNIFRKIVHHPRFDLSRSYVDLITSLFWRGNNLTAEDCDLLIQTNKFEIDSSVAALTQIIQVCSDSVINYLLDTIYLHSMIESDHIALFLFLSKLKLKNRGFERYSHIETNNTMLNIIKRVIEHESFVVSENSIAAIKNINNDIRLILIDKAYYDDRLIQQINLIM